MSLRKSLILIFTSAMVLVLASLILFFQILKTEQEIVESGAKRYKSYLLADELRQSSDDLTRMARIYAVTGEEKYRNYFQRILDIRNGKAPRPEKYHGIYWDFIVASGRAPRPNTEALALKKMMKAAKFTENEFALLRETERESNQLVELETKAMNAMAGLYEDNLGRYTIKRSPNKQLAIQLLHSKEYNKAKEKIMEPLEKFFDAVSYRTAKEVAFHREKRERFSIILMITMSLSILLLLISSVLVIAYFHKRKEELVESLPFSFIKNNFWSNWPFIASSTVIIFIVASLSWWVSRETKVLINEDLQSKLNFNLETTYSAVIDWIEKTHAESDFFLEVINNSISKSSFQEIQTNQFQNFNKEIKRIGVLNAQLFNNYILVNSKGIVASSNHKKLVGKNFKLPESVLSEIKKPPHYRATLFPSGNKAIHPLLAQNILFGTKIKGNKGTIFFIVSPLKELNRVFRRGFSGNSSEAYMVNHKGQFISESRWRERILDKGWLKSEKSSSIGLKIAQSQENSQAFTQSVTNLIQKNNRNSWAEYENYLGDKVVGVWRWNNPYQFGIVTEIKSEEAFRFLNSYIQHTFLGTTFTIFLIFILTFLFIWNQLKISKVNKELGYAYKTIKQQNESLARDLEIGQKIQMDMLPDMIKGNGFSLGAFLKPAQTVSGDFYDFSFLKENKIYFCIGDVSGKGVGAALFMSMTKVFLNKTLEQSHEVKELISKVNKELALNNDNCMFVTLIAGIIDLKTGITHITNAGHNPPYLKKQDGQVLYIEKTDGPLIGAFEQAEFEQQAIKMSRGDTLLFYTDGVTEAQNTKEEFYEDNRLKTFLEANEFPSPQKLVDSISNNVTSFIGEASQFDDITILALKYSGYGKAEISPPS